MTKQKPSEVVFSALKDLGEGWHSRSELAKKLGKKRLFSYESALLDELLAADRIEVERRPANGPIGYQLLYRVKEGQK